ADHPSALFAVHFFPCLYTKKKRHRAFSHAVSDSIFISALVLELNLMTLVPGTPNFSPYL
ncbi:hypothetical protein M5W89_14770, partial [Paenibacillus thiaminolyticus]|uniref:hypothetical protein n=1 Tax=Paenibacillus thiaminolyticus TaxID=49283 RepID=UPI002281B489